VGRNLAARFPSAGHFASWLGLCPDNDKSGGQVLWTGVRRVNNRAAQMFRIGASSLHHNRSRLGGFLRRMKAKLGPAAGITARAPKLAQSSSTRLKRRRLSTTTEPGPQGMHNERSVSNKNSSGKPASSAMNSCLSKPRVFLRSDDVDADPPEERGRLDGQGRI